MYSVPSRWCTRAARRARKPRRRRGGVEVARLDLDRRRALDLSRSGATRRDSAEGEAARTRARRARSLSPLALSESRRERERGRARRPRSRARARGPGGGGQTSACMPGSERQPSSSASRRAPRDTMVGFTSTTSSAPSAASPVSDDDEPHVARDLRRGGPDAVRRVHDLEHARRERARLVVGAGARRPHRRVRARSAVRVLDEPQRRARDRAERVALGARRAAAEAERRARRAGPSNGAKPLPRRVRARARAGAGRARSPRGGGLASSHARRAAHVIPEIAVVVSLAPTAGSESVRF